MTRDSDAASARSGRPGLGGPPAAAAFKSRAATAAIQGKPGVRPTDSGGLGPSDSVRERVVGAGPGRRRAGAGSTAGHGGPKP